MGVEPDDVRNGKQIWGQRYNRKVSNLLSVENDIARAVSQRLRMQLSAADQQRLNLGSTSSPEAYQLYLKGSFYTYKFTKQGFSKGIDYLNQAIALDQITLRRIAHWQTTTSIKTIGLSLQYFYSRIGSGVYAPLG